MVSNSNAIGLDSSDPAAKDDLVVLGEVHVPVDRDVIVDLSSKDVIHNFCLPAMRIAQDAIPGQVIPMWFRPIKTGTFEVVCGQLCGLGHYGMKGTLVVDTPEEYQAWLKERVELSGNQSAAPAFQRLSGRAAGRTDARHRAAAGRSGDILQPWRRIRMGTGIAPESTATNDAHARRRNESFPPSLCLVHRSAQRFCSFAAAGW